MGEVKRIAADNTQRDAALEELQLIEIEADPEIVGELHRLKEIQERCDFRLAWIYYKLIENFPDVGLVELQYCARLLGYKPSWAAYKYAELQQQF